MPTSAGYADRRGAILRETPRALRRRSAQHLGRAVGHYRPGGRRWHRLRARPQLIRRTLLSANSFARSLAGRSTGGIRALRRHRRHHGAHRRHARRLEGAGRHRGDAQWRRRPDGQADRLRERPAQPARRQLPAHVPGLRPRRAGARARCDGADELGREWKYIPIRRLALFIEESLFRGTKWVVFEPNDEPLWAQIRLNVGAFMNGLFRQGAFQGATPEEAFFVKCDERDDDAGRSQPRHRQHRGRLRAAEAGRVRRHHHPADRRRSAT